MNSLGLNSGDEYETASAGDSLLERGLYSKTSSTINQTKGKEGDVGNIDDCDSSGYKLPDIGCAVEESLIHRGVENTDDCDSSGYKLPDIVLDVNFTYSEDKSPIQEDDSLIQYIIENDRTAGDSPIQSVDIVPTTDCQHTSERIDERKTDEGKSELQNLFNENKFNITSESKIDATGNVSKKRKIILYKSDGQFENMLPQSEESTLLSESEIKARRLVSDYESSSPDSEGELAASSRNAAPTKGGRDLPPTFSDDENKTSLPSDDTLFTNAQQGQTCVYSQYYLETRHYKRDVQLKSSNSTADTKEDKKETHKGGSLFDNMQLKPNIKIKQLDAISAVKLNQWEILNYGSDSCQDAPLLRKNEGKIELEFAYNANQFNSENEIEERRVVSESSSPAATSRNAVPTTDRKDVHSSFRDDKKITSLMKTLPSNDTRFANTPTVRSEPASEEILVLYHKTQQERIQTGFTATVNAKYSNIKLTLAHKMHKRGISPVEMLLDIIQDCKQIIIMLCNDISKCEIYAYAMERIVKEKSLRDKVTLVRLEDCATPRIIHHLPTVEYCDPTIFNYLFGEPTTAELNQQQLSKAKTIFVVKEHPSNPIESYRSADLSLPGIGSISDNRIEFIVIPAPDDRSNYTIKVIEETAYACTKTMDIPIPASKLRKFIRFWKEEDCGEKLKHMGRIGHRFGFWLRLKNPPDARSMFVQLKFGLLQQELSSRDKVVDSHMLEFITSSTRIKRRKASSGSMVQDNSGSFESEEYTQNATDQSSQCKESSDSFVDIQRNHKNLHNAGGSHTQLDLHAADGNFKLSEVKSLELLHNFAPLVCQIEVLGCKSSGFVVGTITENSVQHHYILTVNHGKLYEALRDPQNRSHCRAIFSQTLNYFPIAVRIIPPALYSNTELDYVMAQLEPSAILDDYLSGKVLLGKHVTCSDPKHNDVFQICGFEANKVIDYGVKCVSIDHSNVKSNHGEISRINNLRKHSYINKTYPLSRKFVFYDCCVRHGTSGGPCLSVADNHVYAIHCGAIYQHASDLEYGILIKHVVEDIIRQIQAPPSAFVAPRLQASGAGQHIARQLQLHEVYRMFPHTPQPMDSH